MIAVLCSGAVLVLLFCVLCYVGAHLEEKMSSEG